MNHLDDDTLLMLALELLDGNLLVEAGMHLAECADCRRRLERQRQNMALLGSIVPETSGSLAHPVARPRAFSSSWVRAAALILMGFFAGWMTSRYMTIRNIRVVPANVIVQPPADSLSRCAPADAMAMTERRG